MASISRGMTVPVGDVLGAASIGLSADRRSSGHGATDHAASSIPPAREGVDLAQIWREHRGWVAAVLLAHKPREAELEDLLQTVAAQAARGLGEVRGGPGAIRAWLRAVAINAARAEGRRASVRRRGAAVAGLAAESVRAAEPAPQGDRLEEGLRLLRAARGIPDGYREPLLMRCLRGMSYRQIGEALGLPETTIETRIARGRRMLREAAEREERSDGGGADVSKPSGRAEGSHA